MANAFLIGPGRGGSITTSKPRILNVIIKKSLRFTTFRNVRRRKIAYYLVASAILLCVYRYLQECTVDRESLVAYENEWVGFPDLKFDCQKALSPRAFRKLRVYEGKVQRISSATIAKDSQNCETFKQRYGFNRYPPPTDEERRLPLAFTIIFHDDIDQVLFLLRAIYRPHNVYCLHVDLNSGDKFIEDVKVMAACLPNVFVAPDLHAVVYEGYSRLEADLSCMRELLKHGVRWKYLLNMPGKEFPLKTNLEMVRIIKLFDGMSNIASLSGKSLLPQRYIDKHVPKMDNDTGKYKMHSTEITHGLPPHGLKVFKGSAYGIFTRAFVKFAMESKVSQDLLEWSKDVNSPDEYFWAMLIRAPKFNVPGAYTPDVNIQTRRWVEKINMKSYVSWLQDKEPCVGEHYVRDICIFSIGDLPYLVMRRELFVNKVSIERDPAILHCLDQVIYNLTFTRTVRHMGFYRQLRDRFWTNFGDPGNIF